MPRRQAGGNGGPANGDAGGKHRLAVVDGERCRPSKCGLECKRFCPVNAQAKLCVEVTKQSQTPSRISEGLCNGCGICVRKCPFQAIRIVNIPSELSKDTTHRYAPNAFKLHRLPMPRAGQVVGLLGQNGLGKSTALGVLSGKIKPNHGRCEDPPSWAEVLESFRGSALQPYFRSLLEGNLRAVIKPQYVDRFQDYEGLKPGTTVMEVLESKDQKQGGIEAVANKLELQHLYERKVSDLSGGELQRVAIAATCLDTEAGAYVFDEPSAYLDVKQRLRAAEAIRQCVQYTQKYIYVVEHDLAVLDFVSDIVCCLWGTPGAYGVVTSPSSASEGINHYLDGYFPTENLRVRTEPLTFCFRKDFDDRLSEKMNTYEYPKLGQEFTGGFKLDVEPGSFGSSEVIVMLGENGMGKTTMIRLLAQHFASPQSSKVEPDAGGSAAAAVRISYKPQMWEPKFKGTVRELLQEKINVALHDPVFQSTVLRPLAIEQLEHLQVKTLSGGERQRVAIVLTLGKPADLYLIDEPSAYLDVEQRFIAARTIRRYMLSRQKTAFVVEHDFVMATYLADSVIVFRGKPGRECIASAPKPLVEGMNEFLKSMDITVRRTGRSLLPRINKPGGRRDQEQKQAGVYFSLEEEGL